MLKPVELLFVEKRGIVAVDVGENPRDDGLAHHFGAVLDLVTLAVTVESLGLIVVEHYGQLVRAPQFGVLFLHFPTFSDKGNRRRRAVYRGTAFLINLLSTTQRRMSMSSPTKPSRIAKTLPICVTLAASSVASTVTMRPILAATAERIPAYESSKTKQSAGSTPIFAAAFRKMSGAGLPG